MPPAAADSRIRACTAPTPRRGGSTARRCCCSGAGPRALLLQIAHPRGRGRGQRPLRLPRRPVAPAGGHAAQLPDDRLRLDRRGARRDPAAQHAPSRDHRTRLRGARPRALAVGPRDAGRLDDGGRRRVARTAVAGAPRRVLRRDPADRAGVRRAGRAAAAGHRGVRPIRGGDAGPRRAGRVSRRSPASWPGSSSGRRWRRSLRCCRCRRPPHDPSSRACP